MSYADALPSCSHSTPTPSTPSPVPRGPRMTTPVRVGTRGSASPAPSAARSPTPVRAATGREVELVEVRTDGDRSTAPLAQIGGTGVFVGALRDALLRGDVDVAVHSLKDLPTAPAADSSWPPYPRARTRATPRGTRRADPGRAARPAARSAPARPAASPSSRRSASAWRWSGFAATSTPGSPRSAPATSTPSSWPAPDSPGSAAPTRSPRPSTRCRCSRPPARVRWRSSAGPATGWPDELRAALDDPRTHAAVTGERAVLAELEAGCSAPVGALAEVVEGDDGDELWLRAVALSPDGSRSVRRSASGSTGDSRCRGTCPRRRDAGRGRRTADRPERSTSNRDSK